MVLSTGACSWHASKVAIPSSNVGRRTVRKYQRLKLVVFAQLLSLACLVACSGERRGSSIPVAISLTPGWPHTLLQDQKLDITATVLNDPGNSGVRWKLLGVGRFTNETTTSVTYVAPHHVTSTQNSEVIATSVVNSDSSATLPIMVLASQ